MDTRIYTSRTSLCVFVCLFVCVRERERERERERARERESERAREREWEEKILAAAYVHADKRDIFQTNSFSQHVQTCALYKPSPR